MKPSFFSLRYTKLDCLDSMKSGFELLVNSTKSLESNGNEQTSLNKFLWIFLFTILFFLVIVALILHGTKKRSKVDFLR